MNYKKIKALITKHSAKITELRNEQKKLIQKFRLLTDQAKIKNIRSKLQK